MPVNEIGQRGCEIIPPIDCFVDTKHPSQRENGDKKLKCHSFWRRVSLRHSYAKYRSMGLRSTGDANDYIPVWTRYGGDCQVKRLK